MPNRLDASKAIVSNTITNTQLASNILPTDRVLKAGDTMTGQLNISSGGLLVTGNVNLDSGALFVDSVANEVGIGTTDPLANLHIIGTANITGNTIFNSGTLFVDSVANEVGIGTTTPTSNLHVVGNASITLGIVTSTLDATNTMTLQQTRERVNVSATAMSANLTIDLLSGAITYLTANSTANSTINFRGNSTATLDSILAANQSMSSVIMITNGATGYRIANVQIDGTTVTPKWSGNTTPTANTNAIDIFAFTLIKTAANTYTVLGSKTEFV